MSAENTSNQHNKHKNTHSLRLSKSFCSFLKETPQEAEIISHQLMLRASLINMMSKGVYAWLPMAVQVLNNLKKIINHHMQRIGFEEIIMPVLQPAALWKKSGRYDAYGAEMLRMTDRHDVEFVYGPTAEECVTEIFDRARLSYNRLPVKLYNIQWKFRDEMRPRYGVMRSREFLMKDGYTFDIDEESALNTYKTVFDAYMNIFTDMGLKVQPAVADTGVIGGNLSHDFHVLSNTGENVLFYDAKWKDITKATWSDIQKLYSVSKENHTQTDRQDLIEQRSIEVGHNFLLGTKYSASMDVKVQTANGLIHPIMGCYGIGVSRLIGAVIEANHDEKGIVWPKNIAPYDVHLVCVNMKDEGCVDMCDKLYQQLSETYDVIYDDTISTAGEKFSNADLLGIPLQIIVGPKDLLEGQVTIKTRSTGEKKLIAVTDIMHVLSECI